MTRYLAAAVILAAVALAGCGGSGAASTGTASAPPSAASVARQLGCTGIEPFSSPTLYAYDEADATCQGHHADIATFTTDAARDMWAAVVRAQGAAVQTGHLYAVGTGY